MTRKYNISYLLTLLTLWCVMPMSAQVTAVATLDSTQIQIGRQVALTLSVTTPCGSKVEMPVFDDREQVTPGVEVVGTATEDSVKEGDDIRHNIKYVLTSFDEGKYEIPSMTMLVNGKEYKTKSIPLVVNTVDVDTAHIEKFFPAKDVQDMPHDRNWLLIIALSIVVSLLAALTYYSYRKTKENKPLRLIKKRTRRLTPHEKAMEGISLLSTDKSIEQKEYFSRLTEILRVYLEERFGIKAMEMTSGEILSQLILKTGMDGSMELQSLFSTADMVKFAKYQTGDDTEQSLLSTVVQFVEKTKQTQPQPATMAEPEPLEPTQKRNIGWMVVCGLSLIAAIALLVYVVILIID